MKVAVVGAGIAGLTAARALAARLGPGQVEVFEAAARPGGHSYTVEVAGSRTAVDMGFIVYNDDNYPHFSRMLRELGVATRATSMSFSVREPDTDFEYGSDSLGALFADRRSLFRGRHWRFLAAVVGFLRQGRRDLGSPLARDATLDEYVRERGVPADVAGRFVEPLAAALWSLAPARVGSFPAESFLRFLHQHGMLRPLRPLPWRTVVGGSAAYVRALVAALPAVVQTGTPVRGIDRDGRDGGGVTLRLDSGERRFDRCVIATHADTALTLLARPTEEEARLLGAFGYSRNPTWLHSDVSHLPRRPAARASWNYVADPDRSRVAVTYWMNRLQGLAGSTPYLVTLNPRQPIAPQHVLHTADFSHPLFDFAAIRAQAEIGRLQGARGLRTYFCGAYQGWGFHEDGARAGLAAAARLLADEQAGRAGRVSVFPDRADKAG